MDKKEVKVMSYEDCLIAVTGGDSEVYGAKGFNKPTAIISIFDTSEKIPENFHIYKEDENSFVKDALFLQFDSIKYDKVGRKLMALNDVKKINLFVATLSKEVEQIVVCCSDGYSCSLAVANGILKLYSEEPKFIPPLFHPSEYCTKIIDSWIDNGMID